jgi:hypothetical protein
MANKGKPVFIQKLIISVPGSDQLRVDQPREWLEIDFSGYKVRQLPDA